MPKWSDAPDRGGWIYWVYLRICNGLDTCRREELGDLINFALYEQAIYVCFLTFEHIYEFLARVEGHRLAFVEGPDITKINDLPAQLTIGKRYGTKRTILHC
jgi:hypothetical protein